MMLSPAFGVCTPFSRVSGCGQQPNSASAQASFAKRGRHALQLTWPSAGPTGGDGLACPALMICAQCQGVSAAAEASCRVERLCCAHQANGARHLLPGGSACSSHGWCLPVALVHPGSLTRRLAARLCSTCADAATARRMCVRATCARSHARPAGTLQCAVRVAVAAFDTQAATQRALRGSGVVDQCRWRGWEGGARVEDARAGELDRRFRTCARAMADSDTRFKANTASVRQPERTGAPPLTAPH